MPEATAVIRNARAGWAMIGCLCWLAAPELAAGEAPARGLVAYYPFDGDARDASGHGNHGTVSGAWLAADKFGNAGSAYDFDGVRSFIELPVSISPSVMPQATIVAWAKAEQEERIATVFSNAKGWQCRTVLMRPSPGRGACWGTNSNGYGSRVWHEVQPGKWTFLAVTYDQAAGKLHFHVNDRRFAFDSKQSEGVEKLFIGKNPHTSEFFGGQIDEVRVYDRVLDGGEIAALHAQFQLGTDASPAREMQDHASAQKLAAVFIAGFAAFVLLLIALNLWIRTKA